MRLGYAKLRILAAGAALAAPAFLPLAHASPGGSDHAQAEAALSDIKAAVTTIMAAEDDTSSGPTDYMRAARRAINVLVGIHDDAYDAHVGSPGDSTGAEGHVNHLLDREANPPFVPMLHGVLVNLLSAVQSLQDALHAKGLSHYEINASQALEALEIAEGRADSYDVFAGMEGAIANTELGIPGHAPTHDGCAVPKEPGYGVWRGWLVWHAVPLDGAAVPVAGSSIVKKVGSMLVFYTPAAAMVHHLCTNQADPTAVHAKGHSAAAHVIKTQRPMVIEVAADGNGGAVPYTAAQAKAGKAIYSKNCESCHGDNLQGTAGPAIAGNDFLRTAKQNGYTVSIIRTIVTQDMPFNNPASLKPKQYADLMAFILASNCLPSQKTPFPTNPGKNFGKTKLAPPAHPAGQPNKNGVCEVK